MPNFTIITDAGDGPKHVDELFEFPNAEVATDDAQVALADMARDKQPNGKHANFFG